MSVLQEAWLRALGVLDQMDAMTPAEAKSWLARAKEAEATVRQKFKDLQGEGQMKEIAARFKLYRRTTKKPMPWNAYLTAQLVPTIEQMAEEQVSRAQRGMPVIS